MSRYNDVAEWYDAYINDGKGRIVASRVALMLRELLPPGRGVCVDLGTGSGVHVQTITEFGWSHVGIDSSDALLKIARRRGALVVKADLCQLPISSGVVDMVVGTMITTDISDIGDVFRETRRVMTSHAKLVLIGPHPCFAGPFAHRTENGSVTVTTEYITRRFVEPQEFERGIRKFVGANNFPLASYVNVALESGFEVEWMSEDLNDSLPHILGIRFKL